MAREKLPTIYPLANAIAEYRDLFPDGKTFAIKRAWLPKNNHGVAGLRLVDAPPEEYICDQGLASGLGSATIRLVLTSAEKDIEIRKMASGIGRSVEIVRFAGLFVPQENTIRGAVGAAGAIVPGELGTGFLHILDSAEHKIFN